MVSQGSDDKCVRCGACLSVCPVYNSQLKERFSPRGKNYLLKRSTLEKKGVLFTETIKACLQCGACSAVCTSGADVCSLIRHERALHSFFRSFPHPVYSVFANRPVSGFLARAVGMLPSGIEADSQEETSIHGFRAGLLNAARVLRPPAHSFLARPDLWAGKFRRKAHQVKYRGSVPRVAFFVGCSQDILFPEIPAKISAILGNDLKVPAKQVCCGLPAWSAGAYEYARTVVKKNLLAFSQDEFDILLTGCASCASMIKKWPMLFEKGSPEKTGAKEMAGKIMEFSRFALEFLQPSPFNADKKVVFQMPCHQRYDLGRPDDPSRLLERNLGKQFDKSAVGCCGQGGIFGIVRPDLSMRIFEESFSNMGSGINMVVTSCSGCLIRLKTGLFAGHQKGKKIKACHVVDIMVPDLV